MNKLSEFVQLEQNSNKHLKHKGPKAISMNISKTEIYISLQFKGNEANEELARRLRKCIEMTFQATSTLFSLENYTQASAHISFKLFQEYQSALIRDDPFDESNSLLTYDNPRKIHKLEGYFVNKCMFKIQT